MGRRYIIVDLLPPSGYVAAKRLHLLLSSPRSILFRGTATRAVDPRVGLLRITADGSASAFVPAHAFELPSPSSLFATADEEIELAIGPTL